MASTTNSESQNYPHISETVSPSKIDPVILGHRLRHFRTAANMTLGELASQLGATASHLSMIENGKREPKVSLLTRGADILGVEVGDFLQPEAPSARAALEISVEKAQRTRHWQAMGLPALRISSGTPTPVLEAIDGLTRELRRQSAEQAATPEEARRANVSMRKEQRERNNYYADLERQAHELLSAVGHDEGPLSYHAIADIADHLNFELRFVSSLPHSTRSVTDLKNRVIFLADARNPDHDPRSVALQALVSYVLGHGEPVDYKDFLRQRVSTNYVTAALMMPEKSLVKQLKQRKKDRDIAIEDIRDAYSVSYEAAAHRFTNLATHHLDIECHFQKVHESGVLHKAYENDGVNFPVDSIGAIEGQAACRYWTCREVFGTSDRFRPFNQYTDTSVGTYWCTAVVEPSQSALFSLSVGIPFNHARWFRGADTAERSRSNCPDPTCCRTPSAELEAQWGGHAWPAARTNAHMLAAMPPGAFPGVDDVAVYEFLAAQQHFSR
ncbi:helix-turn-helix transcriptional regulator [Yaniella halotolerans]|uniref:helix-turn-helix transcriptional regulator n=1 Tax=Yaniella halotolerans TaxID=225453 RepID=UPI0003B5D9A5|nr:helix-turn-helix transcriptional regulator [Yaniella halotolerans]